MGQIATMVEGLIRQGAKGREIIAAIAKAEEEQAKPHWNDMALQTEFDIFWVAWPNKVGKPAAFRAYKTARGKGAWRHVIMAGVVRYVADKPADRPWLNPATFLNQARWEDAPAPVATLRRRTPADAARELLAEMEGLQNGRHRTENIRTGAVALGFSTAKPS